MAGRRPTLTVAALAVLLTATDTYVVVVALPAIASGVGIGLDQLPRAASVVSAFLLGYCAMLPLLGRLSDAVGRVPVLIGCLAAFALGSLLTAGSHVLTLLLVGRALQGLGGGGLVPATLGLVADRWSARERGLPLGAVGAAQELGALLGPLVGAGLLALTGWRGIFLTMLAASLALALAMALVGRSRISRDVLSWLVILIGATATALVLFQPQALVEDVTWGRLYVPLAGSSALTDPLTLIAFGCAVVLLIRGLTGRRALLPLRGRAELARSLDLPGALLLTVALACLLVAFTPSDPTQAVLASGWPILLAVGVLAAAGFGWRLRTAGRPLIDVAALRARPAWAALAASFFVGALLIAVLVEVPLFARLTAYPDSQTGAALVLVRFLAAVPVGAFAGGWLLRRVAPAPVSAAGLVLASAAVFAMSRWGASALGGGVRMSDVVLVLAGLGVGSAIAPVNAALLAAVPARVHGTSSALLVVSRTMGQLVGLSGLTAIGLKVFVSSIQRLRLNGVCPAGQLDCAAYQNGLTHAGLDELHAILLGAAACGLLAAGLALLLGWRRPDDQDVPTPLL